MKRIDIFALGSMVAGLGGSSALSGFGDAIDALAPGWGKKVVAVVSIAAFGAGLVIRTQTSNTNVALAATTGFAWPPTSSTPSSPLPTNP